MKIFRRILIAFLCILPLWVLLSLNRITILGDNPATLRFTGVSAKDAGKSITHSLTDEETRKVKSILSAAVRQYSMPACPFDNEISLAFGDRVFAIAYDGCAMVLEAETGKYFAISDDGKEYFISLFEKYAGYFPFPK